MTTAASFAVPALLAQGLSIHWVVLPTFCAFLALQLFLYLNHRRKLRGQREEIEQLRRQDRAPDCSLGDAGKEDSWPSWVARRFHGGDLRDGCYGRADVLEQLRDWLECDESYHLLQRLSIMAPLFGLLLTVAGFYLLEPSTMDVGNVSEVLHTLAPLVFGVGTGALLAIVNQFLLHFAGKGSDSLRSAACRWFDDCVWKHVETRPQTAVHDAAEAFKAMAATMFGSLGQYQAATAAIGRTSQSLEAAGASLVATVERLRADTATIPDEMKSLRGTASSVIRTLGEVVPNIERTTFDLAEASGALKLVMQEQFGQAAARHQQSAELLAGAVEKIEESIGQLDRQLVSFTRVVGTQTAASEEWARSVRENLAPTQQVYREAGVQILEATRNLAPAHRFGEAVEAMHGSAKGLAAFVRDGVEPAMRRLVELQEATNVFERLMERREEIAALTTSLTQAAEAAEAIRRQRDEIRPVAQPTVPNRNGSPTPKRPFLLRLFDRFRFRGRSHQNGRA